MYYLPIGITSSTSFGKATLEQPTSLPHTSRHDSFVEQATSSGKRTRLIIPGNTIKNMGRILRYPAKIVAPLACAIVLAANALWTMTCYDEENNNNLIVSWISKATYKQCILLQIPLKY